MSTFSVQRTAGGELSAPVGLESPSQPSAVTSTAGASNLGRHPDAPAEKEKACFFLLCVTYIKDKIVSFFRCIFCCDRAATEEEMKAAKAAMDKALGDAMTELHERLYPYPSNPSQHILCVVAAAVEGWSLIAQASFLRSEIGPEIKKGSLQAKKEKILELIAQCNQVKVAEESTPALNKIVEDFSLEKWQLAQQATPLQSIGHIISILTRIRTRYGFEAAEMINKIRASKGLTPL